MAGNGDEEAKGGKDSSASAIEVESTEQTSDGTGKKGNVNGKDGKQKEELSEEDIALKEGLELAVNRLKESDPEIHKQALQHLTNEIRSSTSSMSS